jgi:hypothetical protein
MDDLKLLLLRLLAEQQRQHRMSMIRSNMVIMTCWRVRMSLEEEVVVLTTVTAPMTAITMPTTVEITISIA